MTIRIMNAQNKRCIEAFSFENASLDAFLTWVTNWNIGAKEIECLIKCNDEGPGKIHDVWLKGEIDWSPIGA